MSRNFDFSFLIGHAIVAKILLFSKLLLSENIYHKDATIFMARRYVKSVDKSFLGTLVTLDHFKL